MRVLVIGGTGPTGIPIVRQPRGRGPRRHDPAPRHARAAPRRRPRSRTSTPTRTTRRRCARRSAARRGTSIVAMYGRLRLIAELTAGRCGHFVSVGGVPAYRGWTNAWQHEPAGLPVPVAEDAELVDDPAIDEKGYRIVRTEQAVFAAHPRAAHFRYPYLYGPYQLAPREWSIVRRILDGRRRIVVADDGLTLHHHGYTENAAAAVLRAIEHPERGGGDDLQRRRRGGADGPPGGRAVRAPSSAPSSRSCRCRTTSRSRRWPLLAQPLPTHRVLDLTRLQHQLGYRDVVPAREAVRAHRALARRATRPHRRHRGEGAHRSVRLRGRGRARWTRGSRRAPRSWSPSSRVRPASASPTAARGRPRTHKEFVE